MRNAFILLASLLLLLGSAAATISCKSKSKTDSTTPGKDWSDGKVPAATPPADPIQMTSEAKMIDDLANLRFDKLGHPVVRWDSIPTVTASKENPHRLLVVLVEFSDLRFERFRGKKDQGSRLASYYQEQVFDDNYAKPDTLSHYYYEQSDGRYHVNGKVLPPVRLSKTRRAYGGPNRPAGGDWRNDVNTESMVEEALNLAVKSAKDLDWKSYDNWDPIDHDKDGNTDEADGYIDHFVLVFAGGGQNQCQSLNKIDAVLNANANNSAIAKLDKRQRECADRLWPHRSAVRQREGLGPKIGDTVNRRGGVPISDDQWIYDYNMQSEYTEPSTFIHEFGHSIGLPDVYSRTSSNSTGGWEVMSSTASPSPQNLSAWSRIQLGWLKPMVVLPDSANGSAQLARLDDQESAANRAIMVVLPPKKKVIELTKLPSELGTTALYGGQGNEINRTVETTFDLSNHKSAEVAFDAWWEIEAGWDFTYVEASGDGGQTWTRLLPVDPRHMPAKHGHDGKKTLPGLTGLSGDLDGDGKNESMTGCDPKKEVKSGEDKADGAANPCLTPTWVKPTFDLASYVGKKDVRFRVRYYTDGAAVMRGVLIDNVQLKGTNSAGAAADMAVATFENGDDKNWKLGGFSPSKGRHELLVPHFYLIEYRDPYNTTSYDKALAKAGYSFYVDPSTGKTMAVQVRTKPGVVVWYANGAYAWSENDPAINGPGKGYALTIDSNPNELALPGLESMFKGTDAAFDTHYDIKGDAAQAGLKKSFGKTVCFVRTKAYHPKGGLKGIRCPGRTPAVKSIKIDGKTATYSYEVINSYLPGFRDGMERVGELIDTRERKGKTSYRLRDRALRSLHTKDASFSVEPFDRGVIIYEVNKGKLVEVEARQHPAVPVFNDAKTERWQNGKLPFGGVAVENNGFWFKMTGPDASVKGSAATIHYGFK